MVQVYAEDFIYVVREEMSIYDYKLKLIKQEPLQNVHVYKDHFVDISGNIAKIYKHNELYHTVELPKKIKDFVINEYFIFTYEKGVLTIISIVGNKAVFNASVAKTDILNVELKGELLFIHAQESIVILDIVQKKIIFNLALELQLFDTDGKKMIGFFHGTLYTIDMDKNIERDKIEIVPDSIKVYKDKIFLKKEKELFLMKDKEPYLITDACFAFDIKDDFMYSLENKLKKYDLHNLLVNSVKFLTVDDSTTMRLIIKNSITNNFEGVEVFEAKDGQDALDVLEEHPDINVIFMDWNMPVMDGREATIKISENPDYAHVKIIMATTEGGKAKVQEMIKYGVKGYLVKPLKPTSVVPVVEKMIELVKKEQDV